MCVLACVYSPVPNERSDSEMVSLRYGMSSPVAREIVHKATG